MREAIFEILGTLRRGSGENDPGAARKMYSSGPSAALLGRAKGPELHLRSSWIERRGQNRIGAEIPLDSK